MVYPALCPYCHAILFGERGGRLTAHIEQDHPDKVGANLAAAKSGWAHYRKKVVFKAYGKRCLRCGATKYISIDHVLPLGKGGLDNFFNWQPLCKTCNSWKSGRYLEFRPE